MTSNSIQFYSGSNGTEVLRLSKDGVWANPDIPVDEAAKMVLAALDYNIKVLVEKAVNDEREACCSGEIVNAANIGGGDYPHQVVAKYQAAIRARGQA